MGAIDHEHVSRIRRTGSIGAIFLTAFASLVIPTPVRVRANISVSAIDPTGRIAAGGAHTCVLLVIGTVTCFGSNSAGQIGLTPGTAPNPTPTAVTLETMATHVSAGEEFTCVLLTTAAVHCFGDNSAGQLGCSRWTHRHCGGCNSRG